MNMQMQFLPEATNPNATYIETVDIGSSIVAVLDEDNKNKLPTFLLYEKDNEIIRLGLIRWHGGKFVWDTDELMDCVCFSSEHIKDIAKFIDKLNDMWKRGMFKNAKN